MNSPITDSRPESQVGSVFHECSQPISEETQPVSCPSRGDVTMHDQNDSAVTRECSPTTNPEAAQIASSRKENAMILTGRKARARSSFERMPFDEAK